MILLILLPFSTFAQKFAFRCVEGDTLLNDPACHWCEPDQEFIMYGIEVTSPTSQKKYIRHPYEAYVRNDRYFGINFSQDSTLFFDTTRVDMTEFTTAQLWVDTLNNCPLPPLPDIGLCCQEVDTFFIQNDSLCISLTSLDTVYCVDLSIYRDSLSVGATTIFREYFSNITGPGVVVGVNGGTLPSELSGVGVFVEGIKQKEGPPGVGDYEITGANVSFNYALDEEDVEVIFFWSTTDAYNIFRQYFADVSAGVVTVTENGGVIPVLNQALSVFVEGMKQQEGPTGDYEIVSNQIVFNYTLDSEDVEVIFILGINDLGFLGLFQDN